MGSEEGKCGESGLHQGRQQGGVPSPKKTCSELPPPLPQPLSEGLALCSVPLCTQVVLAEFSVSGPQSPCLGNGDTEIWFPGLAGCSRKLMYRRASQL